MENHDWNQRHKQCSHRILHIRLDKMFEGKESIQSAANKYNKNTQPILIIH